MKTLRLENANSSVQVDYRTDMSGDGSSGGNFQVLQVLGLDDAEQVLGISFRRLVYNLRELKQFAIDNNLQLSLIENGLSTPTVLQAIGTILAISNTSPLTPGTHAVAYSATITATGGNGPYTYAVTAGALPVGFTLTSAGVLAGTSTAATYNFTITATDYSGQTVAKAFVLVLG